MLLKWKGLRLLVQAIQTGIYTDRGKISDGDA